MRIERTPIGGVFVVHTSAHTDERGTFERWFCDDDLREMIGERVVHQINCSTTRIRGTVRGMHYQRAPHAEMKFVRCLGGRVFDVALDLRRGSPTFMSWFGVELDPINARMLIVPEGCAHGFQALTPDAMLLYLHTARYAPGVEGGVAYDDPLAAIRWPLDVDRNSLSQRDLGFPHLDERFEGIAA